MTPVTQRRAGLDRAELERAYVEHVARLQHELERALDSTGWDGVLVHSGVARPRSSFDDQFWSFRPSPPFAHFLPLAVPDCAVLVVPGRRPTLFHWIERGFWEGVPEPETDHFWGAFDVVEIRDAAEAARHLPRDRRLAFVAEDVVSPARWGLAEEAKNPQDLVARMDAIRSLKSRYEVMCLAEANRRAALGHVRLREAFLGGDASELRLHLMFLEATQQDDPETPYKNIVALDEHGAILHHVTYGRTAAGRGPHSLLLDAGATCQGYHSDVTRTYVKGDESEAGVFAELVRRLDEMQRALCARVEAGLPFERLHDESHERLAPILRDLGISSASAEELVESGATRKFYPHGLGHSLGLQTHDVGCAATKPRPDNPFLRNTSRIAVGQCFTIEPGCYFNDLLLAELRREPIAARIDWNLVDRLRRFGGVRVEDDLYVGERGVRNLTREALQDG